MRHDPKTVGEESASPRQTAGSATYRSGPRSCRELVFSRRAWLGLVSMALVSVISRETAAQSVQVPPALQAGLLAKVASYDRNFAARAGERARVLLVVKPSEPESSRVATELKAALASIDTVGGLPHDEEIVSYADARSLAASCTAKRASIVYFGPGFGADIGAIRTALAALDVLSVGGLTEYVNDGLVLGFNLVSGKPKLLVNLRQAHGQHVDFRADALKLMTVVE